MDIILNGRKKEIQDEITLTELIQSLQLKEGMVVVEVNESVVKKENYTATKIQSNDQVEILRFVGGG